MTRAIRAAAAVSCLTAAAAFASAAGPPPPSVTADFSGGGRPETITARAKSGSVRLEARDASGKRIARADAPAPSGEFAVTLAAGSIGSSGALLEVAAVRDGTACRSVWRLRDGALSRLPLKDGAAVVGDCESEGWTSRWDETRNEPARYLRERARVVPQGNLHESRVYVFAGFEMTRDARKSSAEINGAAIPAWIPATLYAKPELEALVQRYAITGLVKKPRVSFEADRENGVFAVNLSDAAGDVRLPVTATAPFEGDDPGVELTAGDPPVRVRVLVAGGRAPRDAVVRGLPRFDGGYASVTHWSENRIEVFSTAEQELALQFLPGAWTTERNERLVIAPGPSPATVKLGASEVSLRLRGAPEGTDLLLVPSEAGAPAYAVTLRGPNAFRKTGVRCGNADQPDGPCRIEGEGEIYRRVGSQVNAR